MKESPNATVYVIDSIMYFAISNIMYSRSDVPPLLLAENQDNINYPSVPT